MGQLLAALADGGKKKVMLGRGAPQAEMANAEKTKHLVTEPEQTIAEARKANPAARAPFLSALVVPYLPVVDSHQVAGSLPVKEAALAAFIAFIRPQK